MIFTDRKLHVLTLTTFIYPDSQSEEYDLTSLVTEFGDAHAHWPDLIHLSGDTNCFALEVGSEPDVQCRDDEELWVFGSHTPFTETNFSSQAAKMFAKKFTSNASQLLGKKASLKQVFILDFLFGFCM